MRQVVIWMYFKRVIVKKNCSQFATEIQLGLKILPGQKYTKNNHAIIRTC